MCKLTKRSRLIPCSNLYVNFLKQAPTSLVNLYGHTNEETEPPGTNHQHQAVTLPQAHHLETQKECFTEKPFTSD